jgi:hypothetical protein
MNLFVAFVDFQSFLPMAVANYEAVFYLGIVLIFLFGLPSLFITETPFIRPLEKVFVVYWFHVYVSSFISSHYSN